MTACTVFIPTRANAFSFEFTPVGEIPARPGEEITFKVSFNPEGLSVEFLGLQKKDKYVGFEWDGSELSHQNTSLKNVGIVFSNTTSIAEITFSTLNNLEKDGEPDFFNVTGLFDIKEDDDGKDGNTGTGTAFSSVESEKKEGFKVVDVVPILRAEPVPEPLTMFGAAAALGYGAILKRKYSKKTES
jgi:hypothetical protein